MRTEQRFARLILLAPAVLAILSASSSMALDENGASQSQGRKVGRKRDGQPVLWLKIHNYSNPTRGLTATFNSDDFFFRGQEENIKIFYTVGNYGGNPPQPTSVKMNITAGGSTRREITLPASWCQMACAEWDGKNASGQYVGEWDFRASLEVVHDGKTCTTEEHKIADLLYKHRPVVYKCVGEFSGPAAVDIMLNSAFLRRRQIGSDAELEDPPLDLPDLAGDHDTTDHYQDLLETARQTGGGSPVVYGRGTVASGHAFLQYWHFEPSSSLPESTNTYHEGDWEMFQIAVKLDTSAKAMTPIAVTGSQHDYGQTIRWAQIGNGPGSPDQDYVGKSGDQPLVYVALRSHATYFRNGYFRTKIMATDNHGYQYHPAPADLPQFDDRTGDSSHQYTLRTFHDNMISHWQGRWGQDQWPPFTESVDGPRSPRYRATAVTMWTDPKGFHNYYLKLDEDSEIAHDEIEIP